MKSSELMLAALDNFPNADFVFYSPLACLTRAPEGRSLQVPERRFIEDTQRLSECKRGTSVTFLIAAGGIVTGRQLSSVSDLTLKPEINPPENPSMDIITDQKRVVSIPSTGGNRYAQQRFMLDYLGFDGLKDPHGRAIMKPEQFSEGLNATINGLRDEIAEHAGDKPVILVNPLKGF